MKNKKNCTKIYNFNFVFVIRQKWDNSSHFEKQCTGRIKPNIYNEYKWNDNFRTMNFTNYLKNKNIKLFFFFFFPCTFEFVTFKFVNGKICSNNVRRILIFSLYTKYDILINKRKRKNNKKKKIYIQNWTERNKENNNKLARTVALNVRVCMPQHSRR